MPSRTRTHCPGCGSQYRPHARICAVCGRVRDLKSDAEIAADQGPTTATSSPTYRQLPPRPARKRTYLPWVLGTVGFYIVGRGLLGGGAPPTPATPAPFVAPASTITGTKPVADAHRVADEKRRKYYEWQSILLHRKQQRAAAEAEARAFRREQEIEAQRMAEQVAAEVNAARRAEQEQIHQQQAAASATYPTTNYGGDARAYNNAPGVGSGYSYTSHPTLTRSGKRRHWSPKYGR